MSGFSFQNKELLHFFLFPVWLEYKHVEMFPIFSMYFFLFLSFYLQS